jgi:biotin carboxyl carrier protein
MPDARHARTDARDEARRRADHAAIERLAGELVKALAARLEATGMAEIEVTEGGGRVRVRRAMPAASLAAASLTAADSAGRASSRPLTGLVAVGPGSRDGGGGRASASHAAEPGVATSPAVGYFSPRDGIEPGATVTAGERLGTVDVLGVGHEVTAPIDGVVAQIHIAPGQAVEYGERLVTVGTAVPTPDAVVSEG